MKLLLKLLEFFGKNAGSSSAEKHQTQFKSVITSSSMSTPHRDLPTKPSCVFDVIVVGVSFYQDALEKICANRHQEGHELFVEATIVPDDDNPHDDHAVRVEIDGKTVGHLSRKNAIVWRSKMISDN